MRDVVNLAWRLDLVLRGTAPESLLDTYTEERRAQVRESIPASVQLGRLICVTDPAAAAERDVTVLANRRGRGARPAGSGAADHLRSAAPSGRRRPGHPGAAGGRGAAARPAAAAVRR